LDQPDDGHRMARGAVPAAATLEILRGDASSIPFIMATERMPGFDQFVGRWEESQHRAALLDGRHAYFVARHDGAPVGFAIVRDWASPERVTSVKRIAVSRPGHGIGRMLLVKVVDAVFAETAAWRLWLGVFPENIRARRAYEAAGFRAEGVARGCAFLGGRYRDELIMALLRPEWDACRCRGAARP
jgi:RimJ/RimL family protein N-acetyltransferase